MTEDERAEDELYKRFKYFSPEDARRTVDNILKSRDLWQGIRQEIIDNPDGALYIILYLLNHAELMEHGGSVPGWLTDEGEEMLKLLKAKREAT